MVKLEKSEVLGRVIRRDDAEDLAKPTWQLVREAIQAGKTKEALAFLDYAFIETKTVHDSFCTWIEGLSTYVANFREEEIHKFLRIRYEPRVRHWLSQTPGVKESLERGIEYQRAHGGHCTIKEESTRYVVTCDPCGSGGQLRRGKDVGIAKKAYPWTWNKNGVSYYCSHCCVFWEIIPIEARGYPIRITLIGKKPEDPCVHLYYKKPELIPEKYFMRVGLPPFKTSLHL
jgi:hypothetical protein